MNFLAHIYLSNNNPDLEIGNFIADFIKGNQYHHLSNNIQQGIFLHREIDTFTDAHQTVKQSKRRLDKRYGLYSGIIIDIFYDHFLAKNWQKYHQTNLTDFSNNFYRLLEQNKTILPEKIKQLLPYLVGDNWLLNYANFSGIEKTLTGMNNRTQQKSQMHLAITDLKLHYDNFEQDFTQFFEKLIYFSNSKIKTLNLL